MPKVNCFLPDNSQKSHFDLLECNVTFQLSCFCLSSRLARSLDFLCSRALLFRLSVTSASIQRFIHLTFLLQSKSSFRRVSFFESNRTIVPTSVDFLQSIYNLRPKVSRFRFTHVFTPLLLCTRYTRARDHTPRDIQMNSSLAVLSCCHKRHSAVSRASYFGRAA